MSKTDAIKGWIEIVGADWPWLIFAAIAVLPGFGFPASVLLVLAGVIWGANPASCALAFAAVGLNIAWTHLAASGVAKPVIGRVLGNRWKNWRDLPPAGHLRLAVILRLTPGIPLCVQNYLLSLTGVPLRISLAVALPPTAFYVCGFVLTGGALFEGRTGLLVVGLSLLVVASVVIRWVHLRFGGPPITPAPDPR